jgi:hypothetical protein
LLKDASIKVVIALVNPTFIQNIRLVNTTQNFKKEVGYYDIWWLLHP